VYRALSVTSVGDLDTLLVTAWMVRVVVAAAVVLVGTMVAGDTMFYLNFVQKSVLYMLVLGCRRCRLL